MFDIDFVILWVDGNDPEWKKELEQYSVNSSGDKSRVRFRDWDNLHYIFRAFEQFTSWVRKIHFVTWGHIPAWLDIENPKLNIVKHSDYMDTKNLPLFNANPIEINLHKIEDLAEKFVFFNDDFFLTAKVSKERFFQKNLPCDSLVSNAISSSSGVGHFVLNNLEIINRHFSKKEAIYSSPFKWFNYKYGTDILRNLALLPWPRFTGFVDPHQPQPFLKSTFEEIWEKEQKLMEKTSASKFRNCNDVNQYLFRYWQLCKGNFVPVSMKDTHYVTLGMDGLRSGKVTGLITSGKYPMICLNDGESIRTEEEFEEAKIIIKDALEAILPDKSSFEV